MKNDDGLTYDWNAAAGEGRPAHTPVELCDETLRDGLQSASVVSPPVAEALDLIRLMERLGIDLVNVGLPGAGKRQAQQAEALVREIVARRMAIKPLCAARTFAGDITPIVEIAQRTGVAIGVGAFIGSSPIRKLVQGWDLGKMIRMTEEAVRLATRDGLPVTYVTEDTTRAHPDDLRALYTAAIQAGASRVCVADTVGHATPEGTETLIRFIASLVARENPAVRIEFHGHQDRGLAVANSLAALRAGAHAVHACGLGVGERVGNTPMDQLLVNLHLLGWSDRDLTALPEYVERVSLSLGVAVPDNTPAVGRDAFRTGTGVHADAILKARLTGREALADRVYSAVPASLVGRSQTIEIGPMSGASNVVLWLVDHGHEVTADRVTNLLVAAKSSDRVLTALEIERLLQESRGPAAADPQVPAPFAPEPERRAGGALRRIK